MNHKESLAGLPKESHPWKQKKKKKQWLRKTMTIGSFSRTFWLLLPPLPPLALLVSLGALGRPSLRRHGRRRVPLAGATLVACNQERWQRWCARRRRHPEEEEEEVE